MNTKELKERIERVKTYTPEIFNEILHVVVPFYMVHQNVFGGTIKLHENKYKITNSELDVLRCLKLARNKDHVLSPTQIFGKLMFTSGAITKVLKKLEERGYIKRLNNEYDKRSKLVQLTPEGDIICTNALIDVFEYEQKFFSKLTKDEQETFKNLCIKLLAKDEN